MNNTKVQNSIESFFRKKVRRDKNVNNAYLLVHSERLDFHMNIAEGNTGNIKANSKQANYMASVGKLFTSTIISILYEKNKLSFDDKITKYLDSELLDSLHIYRGKEYTEEILIKHLLKQTSGLFDDFWPLLDKILEDKDYNINPRKAIIWGKKNLKSSFKPGSKVKYTDTNYHILGLIIESITGKEYYEVLNDYIFKPLGMEKSSMLNYSKPIKEYEYPIANFSFKGKIINKYKNYGMLDYSGGGIVSTNEDLLKFMKALVSGEIISKSTLEIMKKDSNKLFFGIDYGYGIWKLKKIPIIMPKKFNCWGCFGVTGAFLFYHPKMDAYFIGNFNDVSYKRKGLKFMIKVIKELLKLEK